MKILVFCGFLAICSATPCWAQEWGDLNLKFIVEGKVPEPRKLPIDKDQSVCGKREFLDETITVGKGGELANAVVFLNSPRVVKVPIHPDYEKSASDLVTVKMIACRFQPHVSFVRTLQTLGMVNKDTIGHNPKIAAPGNSDSHAIIPTGRTTIRTFTNPESVPSPASCSVHPWMSAFIVIRGDPYAGVSASDGTLKIANLPTGKWNFSVWHESRGFLKSVKIGGKEVVWPKGQVEFEITKDGGKTPLEIGVPVETLLPSK